MTSSQSHSESRFGLIRSCVADLMANGIDLAAADAARVKEVVHEYLDYFQMMLGYEPGEREVISLIRHETAGGDHPPVH